MTLIDRMRARFFAPIFPGNRFEPAARGLYESVVAQAREPAFYRDLAVPDTVDGRFDLLVLHAYLVMRRLKSAPPPAAELSQTLFDLLFFDMDQSVRVSGVGDLKVGPKVTAMGRAFYGRVEAYDAALAEDAAGAGSGGERSRPEALCGALNRNLYRGVAVQAATLRAVAGYLHRQIAELDGQDDAALLAGRLRFAPPPQT